MFRAAWYLLLVLLCGCGASNIEVGKIPPDDLGVAADGKAVRVSEHRGQVVVISFFASWCGPCRKELPVLESIQRHLGKDRVFVVAVDYKEEKSIYELLLKELDDYTLTFTHDPDGSIGAGYDVKGIPRLVIIGKDGKIASEHVGFSQWRSKRLAKEIERLVAP